MSCTNIPFLQEDEQMSGNHIRQVSQTMEGFSLLSLTNGFKSSSICWRYSSIKHSCHKEPQQIIEHYTGICVDRCHIQQGESIFTLCFWWEVYFTELSAHHITLQFVHIPACFGTAQSGCKFSHKIQTSVKGNKSVQKQKKQEEKTKEEEYHSVTNIFYLCVCRIKIREFYLMIHFSLLSHETCLWSYTVFFKLSTWTLLPHYILFSYWEDYFAASYFYRAIQISGSIFFYILQIAKLYKQPQLHCGCQCEGKGQYIFLFQHGMPEDADFGYLFWHAVSLPWPTLTFTLQSFILSPCFSGSLRPRLEPIYSHKSLVMTAFLTTCGISSLNWMYLLLYSAAYMLCNNWFIGLQLLKHYWVLMLRVYSSYQVGRFLFWMSWFPTLMFIHNQIAMIQHASSLNS
ncbi:uncharacterized protein [Elaeis guineensis]|uniref:uncharacterized protein isoform X1 n=1 Tax=Elaeis guineensis var. tenera TaxID=51953 RepID=UPI003C6D37B4